MNLEFIFILGCLAAGFVVVFAFLWSVIHAEEADTERWIEEGREALRAMGTLADAD